MTTRCVACGGETGEDALRCGSCGLAFGTAREGEFVPSAGPDHVGLYLGQPPALVPAGDDEARAETGGPPSRETAPAGGRRTRRVPGVLIAVAVVVIASFALYLATRRPDDAWTRLESAYQRYAYSDAISAAVTVPDLDPDAVLREIERASPDECALARRSHVPLTTPAGASIHEWTDALVGRIAEISPDWAHELGVPAMSEGVTGEDVVTRARWLLLVGDAWKSVSAWRTRSDLTPHDRSDGDALLGWLDDQLRGPADADAHLLQWIRGAFHGLARLEVDDTIPSRVRAARAVAYLRDVTSRLPSAVGSLRRPPRAAAQDAAAALEAADRHLRSYPASWSGLADHESGDLGAAAAAARDRAGECAARLRRVTAPKAFMSSGMGPAALACSLRVLYRLEASPREAYDRALDELCAAHDDLRSLWEAVEREGGADRIVADTSGIAELHAAVARWVSDAPLDPLPRIRAAPELWSHESAGAWYMDPGRLVAAGTAVVLVTTPAHREDAGRRRVWESPLRHVLAHEAYPGHRLQALFARSSCVVRRLVEDSMYAEGWACYAEDLIHETGDCREMRLLDEFARAATRKTNALAAMNAILVATGAADDSAVLGLLEESGWPSPTLDQVGTIAAWGDYPLCYLLGADEVRALRREEEERLGDTFDLRAFHTRFLREGPIPVPLIRRQWREENERR